ncbi:MAG: hypothetical protein R3B99_04910 [Polyangiales bacterium]
MPRSFFGQRDRRYPDPGPLLGVAQSVAPTLFAGSLERELSVVTLAAEALDRIAAVAWDARADVVDGAELVLRRAGSGVVVQGRAPMKKLGKLKGRWSLAKGDVIEAAVAFDAKGLAALLADATSGTAVAGQLVATHADASSAVKTKTLLLGGPDVVRALAPIVPDKARGAALDGLLAKPPSLEVRESVQALLDVMETVPPKALIRAAEGTHGSRRARDARARRRARPEDTREGGGGRVGEASLRLRGGARLSRLVKRRTERRASVPLC